MALKKPKIQHDDVDRMPYHPDKSDRYVLIRNANMSLNYLPMYLRRNAADPDDSCSARRE